MYLIDKSAIFLPRFSFQFSFFGAGYRSRVQYLNILDPTQMCDYISEILDAGLLGPLFMVINLFL